MLVIKGRTIGTRAFIGLESRIQPHQDCCFVPLIPDYLLWAGNMATWLHQLRNPRKGEFPGGPVVRALCSQCRGPKFDPWSGN